MSSSRVPAEYLGLARQFRREILHDDALLNAELPRIKRGVRKGLRGRPHTMKTMKAVARIAAKGFDSVPARFRVLVSADVSRTQIQICECRITASSLHDEAWDATEPGISLVGCRLRATIHDVQHRFVPITTISFHALARRFERDPYREFEDVIADLALLVVAPKTGKLAIETGGGFFLGETIKSDDEHHPGKQLRMNSVRTFVSKDQVRDGQDLPVRTPSAARVLVPA